MASKRKCPNCGKRTASFGHHWALSSTCSYPELTRQQKDVLRGVLFVQGSLLSDSEGKARFRVASTEKEFIYWLRNHFDWLASGITRIEGKPPDHDQWSDGEYADSYELRTVSHPELVPFYSRWVTSDGDRTVPLDVEPTPLLLATIFAANGTIQRENGYERPVISASRTRPSRTVVESLFEGFAPGIVKNDQQYRIILHNGGGFFDYVADVLPSFAAQPPSDGLDEPTTSCPECHGRYDNMGMHWQGSTCQPSLTDTQRDVILALITSGAHLRENKGDNAGTCVWTRSVNRDIIEWIDDLLGWLSIGVKRSSTAEQSHDSLLNWLGDQAEDAETQDKYGVSTWAHPVITEYQQHFEEGTLLDVLQTTIDGRVFFRVLYALHGRRATDGSPRVNTSSPVLAITRWRLSPEDVLTLFEPFDPSLNTGNRSELVRVKDNDRFFEVVGRNPVPGRTEW